MKKIISKSAVEPAGSHRKIQTFKGPEKSVSYAGKLITAQWLLSIHWEESDNNPLTYIATFTSCAADFMDGIYLKKKKIYITKSFEYIFYIIVIVMPLR